MDKKMKRISIILFYMILFSCSKDREDPSDVYQEDASYEEEPLNINQSESIEFFENVFYDEKDLTTSLDSRQKNITILS